jgi:hypothetical protein
MNDRANGTILADVAPKDVKQLEVLRPHSAPSMGQRYKQSLEKEKRLEAASKPVQSKRKNSSSGDSSTNSKKENSNGKKASKTSDKKKRRKSEVDEKLEQGNVSLDQADEVEEGINWSDEE